MPYFPFYPRNTAIPTGRITYRALYLFVFYISKNHVRMHVNSMATVEHRQQTNRHYYTLTVYTISFLLCAQWRCRVYVHRLKVVKETCLRRCGRQYLQQCLGCRVLQFWRSMRCGSCHSHSSSPKSSLQ